MRSAILLGFAFLVVGAPHAARAQTPAPPGTLTILSRPTGATYRLEGDQHIVGRTPATVARGLTGRYRVVGTRPGYERWKDAVTLDGTSADTVWMTLHAKSRALAAARSLVIPGWGQFYAERHGRGWFWLSTGAAAATALGWTASRYEQRVEDYEEADRRYQGASTPGEAAAALAARNAADAELQDARDQRRLASGVMAGVWGLAALDAAVALRAPSHGPVSLGLEPSGNGREGMGLAAVAMVRF